jgi:hypothetical protein
MILPFELAEMCRVATGRHIKQDNNNCMTSFVSFREISESKEQSTSRPPSFKKFICVGGEKV